jgi:hypothetical protein
MEESSFTEAELAARVRVVPELVGGWSSWESCAPRRLTEERGDRAARPGQDRSR